MPDKVNNPQIRFEGFTDAWEQHKVGDYYEFKNGLNKGKEFFGEGTPIVNFTDVFHNRGISPEMLSGRVRLKPSEIKNYEVKKGDIFFTRTSETIEEIGYPSVMLEAPENTVFSGFVLRGRCILKDDPLDNLFKKYLFFTDAFRVEMLRKSSMTTRALTSGTAIKNMEFLHPSLKEEQHRIGEFITSLDRLITLHQCKYSELQILKKAMLEKMFPKNGSSVPEIRFKGFTAAWEERKLSHFLEVSSEKNTDNLYTKDDVLSVSGDFGVVNQIEFQGRSFAGASVSNYGVVHTGDVVYTKSPLKANPYGIIKANKGKTGIVSVLYGVYHTRENANADFIQMYFEQDARLNNYLRPLVNKGAKNTILISDTDALEGKVCLAPTFDEQKAIGQFFDSLDHLITLHQRKLDTLKHFKKALLEKMFV